MNVQGSLVIVTQHKYSLDLLKSFDMIHCKNVNTPIASGQQLSLGQGKTLNEPTHYPSLVGAL